MSHPTQALLRETFRYHEDTGRLERVRPGLGARVGRLVGRIDPENGHRRAYFAGKNRMTAHLVWIFHKGSPPRGILRHANGDTSDDRIDNLELLKKQLAVSYPVDGVHVNEYGRLPAHITAGVYEIVCMANGRRYVGSAVRMAARWRLHYTQLQAGRHHSRHLQRAWNKHGEDAFFFRVLEECTAADAVPREQHFIDVLQPEFNSRPTAGSQLGWTPSEETRAKMRASRAGKSSAMKGRTHSAETKAKISAKKSGVVLGPYSADRVAKTAAAMRKGKGAATEDQVRQVRRLKALGADHATVAKAVGLGYYSVADISSGRSFSWVT